MKKSKGPTDFTSIPGGRGKEEQTTAPPGSSKVIDLTSIRAKRNQESRRGVERFFMQTMIDAYCELEDDKVQLPIEIVEVSESGCSFRVSSEKSQALPKGKDGGYLPLPVRLYFSRDSFLRVNFDVINVTTDIAGGGQKLRFGCRLDTAFASSEVYCQFVRFVQTFAQHCGRDTKQFAAY
jgi:hypothetical protein